MRWWKEHKGCKFDHPVCRHSRTHALVPRFRWAVCQIDIIRRLKLESKIRAALKNMPETLDKTYERIFSLIPEEDKLLVQHTLRWINLYNRYAPHGRLPTPMEIVGSHLGFLARENGKVEGHNIYDRESLEEACGCLVSFGPGKGILTPLDSRDMPAKRVEVCLLAHYTVKEFIASERIAQSSVGFFQLPSDDMD